LGLGGFNRRHSIGGRGERGVAVGHRLAVEQRHRNVRAWESREAAPNPVRQMLWSEIMPSRYVRNHRTRRDRLGNDPPLLIIAPPSAADRARYLRAALNDLRVVTNVDHNVHTNLYPKRIAIVHHSPSLSYVG
jgi:hypothetical protein